MLQSLIHISTCTRLIHPKNTITMKQSPNLFTIHMSLVESQTLITPKVFYTLKHYNIIRYKTKISYRNHKMKTQLIVAEVNIVVLKIWSNTIYCLWNGGVAIAPIWFLFPWWQHQASCPTAYYFSTYPFLSFHSGPLVPHPNNIHLDIMFLKIFVLMRTKIK